MGGRDSETEGHSAEVSEDVGGQASLGVLAYDSDEKIRPSAKSHMR